MSCFNSTVPNSSPQDVIVKSNNRTSLNVSWEPPMEIDHNEPIIGFVINYTSDGCNDVMIVNVTSGTTHIISGLVAFAEYSVGVAAVNINGTGPFSDAVVVKPGVLYMEVCNTYIIYYRDSSYRILNTYLIYHFPFVLCKLGFGTTIGLGNIPNHVMASGQQICFMH